MKADLGLYAQDRWTFRRLTLNGGLRFEYFNGEVPAQQAPAGAYVSERNFARVAKVPSWTDLNPRLGGVYRPVWGRPHRAEAVGGEVHQQDGHDTHGCRESVDDVGPFGQPYVDRQR